MTNLFLEIVRLIVDEEAGVGAAPKDKSDPAPAAKIELSRPSIAKIMRKYLTFDLGDSSFGPLVKSEVVVIENYHTSFDEIKYPPILGTMEATSQGESVASEPGEMQEDILAVHVRESENLDTEALHADMQIEAEEADRLAKLKRKYANAIVDIQDDHGVKYAKGQSFQSLLEPALAPEEEDKLARAYRRKGLIGKALQIRDDFQREHARVSALVIAAHQYSIELDRTLKELEEKELALQSAQDAYRIVHE